jgi:hypothetical protein
MRAYEALLAYRNLVEIQKRKGIISREKIVARLAKERSADEKTPHAGESRVDALALLSSAGIGVVPHVRISGLAEALKFVHKAGGPVWMVAEPSKPDARHPRETTGPLAGKPAVKTAFISLRRKFAGAAVVVRSEVSGTCEFTAAGRFDSTFGPMLSLSVAFPAGESGIFAKRICPIRKTDAMSMIRELPELVRLTGASDAAVVVNALTDVLLKLSDVLVNTDGLLELDIRRMVLSGGKLVVTDALATMTA